LVNFNLINIYVLRYVISTKMFSILHTAVNFIEMSFFVDHVSFAKISVRL